MNSTIRAHRAHRPRAYRHPSAIAALPFHLRRRHDLRRRTCVGWLKALAKVVDEEIRSHCARLIWWDYLAADEGQTPDTSPEYQDLMNLHGEQTQRINDVRAGLIRCGYAAVDADARSTPMNATGAKPRTCEGFRWNGSKFSDKRSATR